MTLLISPIVHAVICDTLEIVQGCGGKWRRVQDSNLRGKHLVREPPTGS